MSPGLTIISGNGQLNYEQFRSNVPMVVQARDAAGNPLANLPVTWTITQGQGTLAASDPKTDPNGIATSYFVGTSIPAGLSFTQQMITATTSVGSATFTYTTSVLRTPGNGSAPLPIVQVLAPAQDNRNITGAAGSTVRGGFQVQVVASAGVQQGFPVPNIGMRIVDFQNPDGPAPASCAGTPVSDSKGIATCDLVLTGTPGTYLISAVVGEFVTTPNSFLTITPGASCAFTLSPTTANVGTAGGSGSVAVNGSASCGWTASSSANWITITSGFSGTGNGTVAYAVSPNAGIQRTGTLTIAGQTFTVTQSAPGSGGGLTITSGATLPTALVSTAYSTTITASGGVAPYSFTANSGLPAGFSLNSSTGVLSGTAATVGTFSIPITVRDATSQSQSQTFTLSVVANNPGSSPNITNTSFPNAAIGTPYAQTLNASGGCLNPFAPPPVYSIVSGALPPGLTLNTSTSGNSTISGNPSANGTYNFSLKVTDSCARSGTSNFVIIVGTGVGGPGPGTGGQVVLTPAPNQLQFSIQVGSTTPATQAISVNSNGSSQFSAQAQMTSAASLNWLSVAPTSGSTPTALNVTVNAGALPPGVFSGFVVLIPAGNSGPAVNVPITLRVTTPPTVSVTPTSLFFLYQQGTAPAGSQTLNISSTGNQFDFTLAVATESGGGWLFTYPINGTTPAAISVVTNPIGLAAGTYKGTITITPTVAGIPPLSIPVTLSIPQSAPFTASIVNAASFQPGPVAPGEIVTIFGTALGPRDPVAAKMTAGGVLESVVGETRVLFDGVAAPLVYTGAGQVSAIVPYTISGRSVTRLEVEYRGVRSVPIDLRVVDSTPAIFLVAGTTQAAALNQDTSPNTPDSGAAPGAIVTIYATGEGQTDPGGVDGRFMNDVLAKPLLQVTVQVAGKDAEVLYAGSAPGLPAGLMQVNFRLPLGLPSNTAVPVVLTVGRASSPNGVTIFMK